MKEFIFRGLKSGLIGVSIGLYAPWLFILFSLFGTRGRHVQSRYPFIRGVRREALEMVASELFEEWMRKKIDPVIEDLIREIKKNDGRIMIASSSFSVILDPLARYLDIGELIATELEFLDGVSTGGLKGEPAYGEGKLARMMAYLSKKDILPSDCVFYSDSIHDLPLLRVAGTAVAVNPDHKLHRIALKEGWKILMTHFPIKEEHSA